jgi:hypothetical protein
VQSSADSGSTLNLRPVLLQPVGRHANSAIVNSFNGETSLAADASVADYEDHRLAGGCKLQTAQEDVEGRFRTGFRKTILETGPGAFG